MEYLYVPISDQLPSLAEILNSYIYKPFCVLFLGLSQSLINLLKERKKRNFTTIDLFQIGQLLLKGKMLDHNFPKLSLFTY